MHKSRFRFFVLPILLLALLLPLCTGVHGADLGVERSVFQFLTAELGLNRLRRRRHQLRPVPVA